MKHFIIVANGSFLPPRIIQAAIQGKTIVSLDGATNKLSRMDITPDIILGDFDSINAENREQYGIKAGFIDIDDNSPPYAGKHGVHIVPAKRQSATDLQKAIKYCDKVGAASITILNATGGRLDFHESNLRTLRSHYRENRPLILLTEQQTIRYLKDEDYTISGLPGDECGVVGYPVGQMSSEGLQYETNDFKLEFGFSESTCNKLRGNQAMIRIKGEALVIAPASLQAQRDYMLLSEKQRLEELLTIADS